MLVEWSQEETSFAWYRLTVISKASISLQLAEQDAAAAAAGDGDVVQSKVSPSLMVVMGIEIEELQ